MRFRMTVLSWIAAAAVFSAGPADAAPATSCSAFVTFTSFDEAASSVGVNFGSGSNSKFFPKPEGSPTDTTKIPAACKGSVTKSKSFGVKGTGGRMSITQIRTNFEGKMLNDPDDPKWLPAKLKELIDGKTQVVIIVRPGMGPKAPMTITTVYLPANEADLAEIKRLEDQAEDVE
jgi:hypothetical protein